MTDDQRALVSLLGLNVLAVLIALIGVWVARHRPRVVGTLIGLAVAAGAGLVWYGGHRAQDDFESGQAWFRAGLAVLVYSIPAGLLVAARERVGEGIGPVGARDWARTVGYYLAGCWCVTLLSGCILALGLAPAGSFR